MVPDSMRMRFLFCPETIGSICYLSQNEELIPRTKGGILAEMLSNKNVLALQYSRQDEHLIDKITRYVPSAFAADVEY